LLWRDWGASVLLEGDWVTDLSAHAEPSRPKQ
jgi:hypothetical protein